MHTFASVGNIKQMYNIHHFWVSLYKDINIQHTMLKIIVFPTALSFIVFFSKNLSSMINFEVCWRQWHQGFKDLVSNDCYR